MSDVFIIHPSFESFGGAERKVFAVKKFADNKGLKCNIVSSKISENFSTVKFVKSDLPTISTEKSMLLKALFSKNTKLILSNHPVQIKLLPILMVSVILGCLPNDITWICNEVPFKNRGRVKKLLFSFLTKLFLKVACPKVISNSKKTAVDIERYYSCASEIVYPGIRKEDYEIERSSLDNAPKKDFVLVFGRISVDKNYELLNKLSSIKEARTFVIAGAKTASSHLVQKNLKMTNGDFRFHYDVEFEEKVRLIEDCKFGCFLPEEEPFGVVPLEFIALEKRIIVYSKSGVAQVEGLKSQLEVVQTEQDYIHTFQKLSDSGTIVKTALPDQFTEEHMCKKILGI